MFRQLTDWYKNRFSDPNLSVLFLLLISAFLVFYFFGSILVPLFVALVLAYLLDWPINYLMRLKINRTVATLIVMLVFISIAIFAFLGLLPTVFKQGAALIRDLPAMFNESQAYLLTLPSQYPDAIDPITVSHIVENLRNYLLDSGGFLLSQSFASLLNIAALIVYAILVPLMMVFLLKDKDVLIASFVRFLPTNRKLANQVWVEMNGQIMNYIRGKVIEILIVASGIDDTNPSYDSSEDENAGNPYTNRGRNDDVIGVLMAYGFSADEMRCARPKKVGSLLQR